MKQRLKPILALIIITATLGVFAYYIAKHPDIIDQLKQLSPVTILALLALYTVAFLAYVMITRASLRIYHKTMSRQENILFNAYSSLINFFGLGQSGPVFRGAYLKKRHNLSVKQFMFTLLLYLGTYAVISAMLMFVGSQPWWQTALLMAATAAASFVFVRRYKKRSHIKLEGGLNPLNVGWIFGATVLQVAALAFIYGIELQTVGADASIGEILSYTGVSNFSLFVALTPGAIGIREAFLVFSQNLHHINSSTIVAANIADRAVYLLFLGLLFMLVISLHAKDKLHVNQLKND
ncbi:MAG TPA: lysylphosphatidylglycerol synthase domain-containing protein [Candidatus Saccharimonadales bacterium]